MVFSSLQFIFLFLPIAIVCYYLLNKKFRNVFLLAASLIFYAWGEPNFAIIMIVLCIINWGLGYILYIKRNRKTFNKIILIIGLIVDLGVLFVYKYLNFFTSNLNAIFGNVNVTEIALPIGISFFTFQMLSYLIDVYRDPEGQVCKNPINIGLYISFFPQLIAGPIVRYNTIIDQIKNRKENIEVFGEGVERFIIGLAKKVMIANNMAIIVDKAFSLNASELSTGFAWLGAVAYTLQIYFDFSGYSDMAIGLGKMFGFKFAENFNYPYISKSITDFWRRWHISLSEWFRDYVYIPLGGDGRTKKNKGFVSIRNLFIVWLLTGIWHGAYWTFIIWGLVYFALLLLEKKLIKPEKRKAAFRVVYRIFTLLAIVLLWVVFRADSLLNLSEYFKALFFQSSSVIDGNFIFYAREYIVFLIIAIIASTPILHWIKKKIEICNKKGLFIFTQIVRVIVLLVLMFSAISYLVMGYHNPFIYFNF